MIDPGKRAGRWLLGLLGFLSSAYFLHEHPGWNVNTRLALTYAIVDEHRLTIDSFHALPEYETHDKAFFNEHFYSDKIVGNAFAAIPAYQIARWVTNGLRLPFSPQAKDYVCRVSTVSVAYGLLLMMLAALFERQGVAPHQATGLAALGGLGTLLFPYSTLFYPYVPACLLSVVAYRLTLPRGPDDALSSLPLPRVFLAGLAMGGALLFELLYGLIAIALVLHLLGSQRPLGRGVLAAFVFGVGSIIALIPFWIYTHAIFGRFTIPYEYEYHQIFQEAMASGFMGIHFPPKPGVLWLITFHPFRGLFFHAPILLFAVPGFVAMTRLPHGVMRALVCVGLFVGYLLVNGGYYHHWWGGTACGPRHLIPALPFLLLPVAAAWARWPRLRPAILAAGAVSVALQLLPSGINPQPPLLVPPGFNHVEYLAAGTLDRPYGNPLTQYYLPVLAQDAVARNPGRLLELQGGVSWLPLLALWLGFALWASRSQSLRTSPTAADDMGSEGMASPTTTGQDR